MLNLLSKWQSAEQICRCQANGSAVSRISAQTLGNLSKVFGTLLNTKAKYSLRNQSNLLDSVKQISILAKNSIPEVSQSLRNHSDI